MHNRTVIKKILLLILIYVPYFVLTALHSDFWLSIVGPIIDFTTLLILLNNIFVFGKNETIVNKIIWILFSLTEVVWLVGDSIRTYYYFFSPMNPRDCDLIETIYSSANIFLLIAIVMIITSTYKKWNALQLLLDSISISISTVLTLWICYFHKEFDIFMFIYSESKINIIFIIMDIVALVCISIWYFLFLREKTDAYIRLSFAGISIYAITDLCYYYFKFWNKYEIPRMIDVAFMSVFLLLAAASICKRYEGTCNKRNRRNYNIDFVRRQLILCAFPVVTILLEGIQIMDVITFLVIIGIHNVFSRHIQNYILRETLLIKEKDINSELEEIIRQRTKEITDINIELNNTNIELKNKNAELDLLSNKDVLTNLYNRRYVMKNLDTEINLMNPLEKIAFFYIDLDRFKIINDMYGHQIGDEALIEISRRLQKINDGHFIIARLGGDEFVIIYRGIFENTAIETLACTIINKCSEPILVGEYVFYVSASIGISIYPTDAKDTYTLMGNADMAMYEVKTHGKNGFVFFDSQFKEAVHRKHQIEKLLKKADFDKEFELYFQPQFSTKDKNVIGVESLLRWHSDVLGTVPPAEFIPIAEETDYISTIGDWVMKKAIEQAAIWNKDSYDIKVGFNISPKQLDNKNFITNLTKIMEVTDILPEFIDIELTENIAIEGEIRIRQIQSFFSGLGISISIDDFGTGYSSLSYLKILPFERIKIAKELIDVIATDKFDFEIVKLIINLAKSFGIKTIAEGVESQEQLDILTELGCDQIQGYLLGKPMPAVELEELLQMQKKRRYTQSN